VLVSRKGLFIFPVLSREAGAAFQQKITSVGSFSIPADNEKESQQGGAMLGSIAYLV